MFAGRNFLKRCVSKILALAFGLHLCFKAWRSKTLREEGQKWRGPRQVAIQGLAWQNVSVQKNIASVSLRFRGFPRGQGLRSRSLAFNKTCRSVFALLNPPRSKHLCSGISSDTRHKAGSLKRCRAVFVVTTISPLSVPAQGQQQLKLTPDATSLLRLCCRASVCHSEEGTLDVASNAPRDKGRSLALSPF